MPKSSSELYRRLASQKHGIPQFTPAPQKPGHGKRGDLRDGVGSEKSQAVEIGTFLRSAEAGTWEAGVCRSSNATIVKGDLRDGGGTETALSDTATDVPEDKTPMAGECREGGRGGRGGFLVTVTMKPGKLDKNRLLALKKRRRRRAPVLIHDSGATVTRSDIVRERIVKEVEASDSSSYALRVSCYRSWECRKDSGVLGASSNSNTFEDLWSRSGTLEIVILRTIPLDHSSVQILLDESGAVDRCRELSLHEEMMEDDGKGQAGHVHVTDRRPEPNMDASLNGHSHISQVPFRDILSVRFRRLSLNPPASGPWAEAA
ncbi:hypothetical protein FB45DRAFT_1007373 [Roridomyces roridus]|uniref:Uncharacterized protein n=1 Tax=Roridomyces roridus TaxID=1738132 RepID=A0AAD7BEG4_9AGAR|nr:hypothetical protein FB45DRAFT_1007373 [Roridomyces roridus]